MRNFYTYKLTKNKKKKDINKNKVINCDDLYKIFLVLILFIFLNIITKEIYKFIQTGLKLLILIVILQTFFKDYPIFNKLTLIIKHNYKFRNKSYQKKL